LIDGVFPFGPRRVCLVVVENQRTGRAGGQIWVGGDPGWR
jgi:hypothetical protein